MLFLTLLALLGISDSNAAAMFTKVLFKCCIFSEVPNILSCRGYQLQHITSQHNNCIFLSGRSHQQSFALHAIHVSVGIYD